MTETGKRVIALLKAHQLPFQLIEHAAANDAKSAAEARGTTQKMGVKSLLVKIPSGFNMLTMAADCQLRSNLARKQLKSQKVRFATPEELYAIAHVSKGALPPIGSLFGIPQLIDHSVVENSEVAFTCGSLTTSVIMQQRDLLSVLDYQLASFTTRC